MYLQFRHVKTSTTTNKELHSQSDQDSKLEVFKVGHASHVTLLYALLKVTKFNIVNAKN